MIRRNAVYRYLMRLRKCINYPALPEPWRHSMARITVEDCQQRVDNRFLLVQMAIKRVRQFREGYEPLVESKNKEVVTALREIAAGR